MSMLEARYRRLLAWFPQDHRAVHEDEMIGVLLAGAEPGQTSPGLRDRADLLLSAAKLHARRAFGRGSMVPWRDSAAVVAVVCTVLLALRAGADAVARVVDGGALWIRPALTLTLAAVLLLAIVADSRLVAVPVAALLGAYLFTSWIPWPTLAAASGDFTNGHTKNLIPVNAWALLPVVAGLAVALSSRPRRGITVLKAWRLATMTGLAALTIGWAQTLYVLAGDGHTAVQSLPFLTACAAAAGLALRSERGRRCVALFAPLLLSQVAMSIYVAGDQSPWPVVALLGVVPAVVFGVLGWRQFRHRVPTSPEPTERFRRVTA